MRKNREIRLIGKESLRGNYLVSIANMILILLASFGLQWIVGRLTGTNLTWDLSNPAQITAGMAFIDFILSIIVMFIIALLGIGYLWGFLDLQDDEPMTVGHLGLPFRDKPLKVVGFVFIKQLLITLWSLLLVIPGIVKSYSWAMAEFLYYDNPDVRNKMLLDKSEEMMRGNRWKLFRLDFFYTLIYLVPYLVWVVAFLIAVEGMAVGENAVLYWILTGVIAILIVMTMLMLVLEPRRRAARAVFYTELVALEEE